MASHTDQKVWLVTGSASGLGLELVLAILECGDKVIATSRARSVSKLEHLVSDRCHVMELDVDQDDTVVCQKAGQAISVWGRIDVVINNAGFGVAAVLEEASHAAMKVFQTNFFGAMRVTNAFLPHLRSRHRGTLVFIGSRHAHRTGIPITGLYTTSKAALHALADVYRSELAVFGIKVLTVAPSGLRTHAIRLAAFEQEREPLDPSRPSSAASPFASWFFPALDPDHKAIQDYIMHNKAGAEKFEQLGGNEPGDPRKAAGVIVDVVRGRGVAEGRPFPDWLLLGKDCVNDVNAKLKSVADNLKEWEDVSSSIDFE